MNGVAVARSTKKKPDARVGKTSFDDPGPLISVIMSHYNGSGFLEPAIKSVLNQSYRSLELIVVDDASQDDSLIVLERLAASDPRLVVIALEANSGPAVARNAALEVARGDWLAIVDSDDLLHPMRLERLLKAAQNLGADVVADDLVYFGDPTVSGRSLLQDWCIGGSCQIRAADMVRSDAMNSGASSLGYLKPLIRAETAGSLRYNENLRIGEDFDLYFRILLSGADFRVVPDPTYLYRRHVSSVSHRLTVSTLERLSDAQTELEVLAESHCMDDTALRRALSKRAAHIERSLSYQKLVSAIKSGRGLTAAAALFRRPFLVCDLFASFADRRTRETAKQDAATRITSNTVVLACSNTVDAVDAPPSVLRIPFPNIWAPGAEPDLQFVNSVRKLVGAVGDSPVNIIAEGVEGLVAIGFVPTYRSATLTLDSETARNCAVPSGVELTIVMNG